MPVPERERPAYVNRKRLCELLDIADRTLDDWIVKGFPKSGRHGKWCWAKVERYMALDDEADVASPGQSDIGEEVFHASQEYARRHLRGRAA